MDSNLKSYLFYSVVFLVILILGEIINRRLKLGDRFSRTYAHISIGLISLTFVNGFTSHYYVLALCIQSSLFMVLALRMKLFPALHNVKKGSYGSIVFFIGIYISFAISSIFQNTGFFIIPVMVLSISDPMASWVGELTSSKNWKSFYRKGVSSKTVNGSLAFLISAWLISSLILPSFFQVGLLDSIIYGGVMAMSGTLAELISFRGLDNVFIPPSVLAVMLILL